LDEAKTSNHYLVEKAKAVGLDFNIDECISQNTFDAYRVLHYTEFSKQSKENFYNLLKSKEMIP
jgi:predicted DsbA family dithiol-disulfide isomerase